MQNYKIGYFYIFYSQNGLKQKYIHFINYLSSHNFSVKKKRIKPHVYFNTSFILSESIGLPCWSKPLLFQPKYFQRVGLWHHHWKKNVFLTALILKFIDYVIPWKLLPERFVCNGVFPKDCKPGGMPPGTSTPSDGPLPQIDVEKVIQ